MSEKRVMVYDSSLKVEAYRFEGIERAFPAHFHEHYTIGYMNAGSRRLICGGREYGLRAGNMVLFNPRESHACVQTEGAMDFSGINIPEEVMTGLAEELTGKRLPPRFRESVLTNKEAAACFTALHEIIMSGGSGLGGEEKLLLLVAMVIEDSGAPHGIGGAECGGKIARVREFIERNYAERITLEQLCQCSGLSKSTLLRAFTREMGITPYGYLENVRICEAKRLLENGAAPAEAALSTGFYDQSHFTSYFTRFIGLPPREYQKEYKGEQRSEHNEQ